MTETTTGRNGGRRSRVVILGGGFAGINAAMDLAKLPVDVTIVDRKKVITSSSLPALSGSSCGALSG